MMFEIFLTVIFFFIVASIILPISILGLPKSLIKSDVEALENGLYTVMTITTPIKDCNINYIAKVPFAGLIFKYHVRSKDGEYCIWRFSSDTKLIDKLYANAITFNQYINKYIYKGSK